jgi:CHAD domain-containing protein
MPKQSAHQSTLVTLGDFAHRTIATHFHKSIKHEHQVLKDKDSEPLHQMRVGFRRLGTALRIFAGVINLPPDMTQKKIGKIACRLGRVRDWDVMAETLRSYQQSDLPDAEVKTLTGIIKQIAKHREPDFEQLEHLFDSKFAKFKQHFNEWLEQPCYQPIAQLPIRSGLPDLLSPLISQILLHPAWLIDIDPSTRQSAALIQLKQVDEFLSQHNIILHDLRKLAKKVRYQTEFFVDFYNENYHTQVAEFKTLQEMLGTLQDSAVLQNYLTRALKASPRQILPRVMSHIDRTTHTALVQWQALQPHYLEPEFRTHLRSLVLTPILEVSP